MSGFYLIIPEEGKAAELQINPETFAKQLSSRWEDFEIVNVNVPRDASQLSWTCNIQGESILGDLLRGGNSVAISDMDDEQPLAEFAVWYRTLIPFHIRLFLYHDQMAQLEIEITEHISADEILRQLDQQVD